MNIAKTDIFWIKVCKKFKLLTTEAKFILTLWQFT